MILDDRPVIDQLLDPRPMSIVDEVSDDMLESFAPLTTSEAREDVREMMRSEVKALDLDLSEKTLDALDEALTYAATGIVEYFAGVGDTVVHEMYARLEARL